MIDACIVDPYGAGEARGRDSQRIYGARKTEADGMQVSEAGGQRDEWPSTYRSAEWEASGMRAIDLQVSKVGTIEMADSDVGVQWRRD